MTVTDDDTGSAGAGTTVTVNNVAPHSVKINDHVGVLVFAVGQPEILGHQLG